MIKTLGAEYAQRKRTRTPSAPDPPPPSALYATPMTEAINDKQT